MAQEGLPKSWAWATTGDIARIVGGSTPATKDSRYWDGDIPWLAVSDLTGYTEKSIASGARRITQAGYDSCATQLLPAGSVVFSSRAPIGYVAVAENPLCTSQGFKSFVPEPEIRSDYLYWYLRTIKPLAESVASGTTFKELSGKAAGALPIPVAPVEHQVAIVAALERRMADVLRGEAELEAARRDLHALQRRIQASVYEQGWPVSRLGDLLREKPRNGVSAKASDTGTVRVVTLTAVTQSAFSDKNSKMVELDPERISGLWLEAGDILIQRSNTPELVGSSALYSGDERWAIYPDLLIRVRPREELRPEFLSFVLASDPARRYFQEHARGTSGSMPKITQSIIEELEVPVPNIDDQLNFLASAGDQISACAALDADLDRVARLGQSLQNALLRAAFEGQLISLPPPGEDALSMLATIAKRREEQKAIKAARKPRAAAEAR